MKRRGCSRRARRSCSTTRPSGGVPRVQIDDIFLGNGVSELIAMAMHGLLNDGDEVLIPAPDYPLWTAAVNLAGGRAVHYLCDEESDWAPDIGELASNITTPTRGIVVINPNNPPGRCTLADRRRARSPPRRRRQEALRFPIVPATSGHP